MADSKIAFRSFGEGETVVLLHGYAGSVSHWEPLRPLLAKYYQVVVPNLTHLILGREKFSFSAQVDELARFLREEFRGKPLHLVGLSYGGALAWGLAIRYPELVMRVVLINPMSPDPLRGFQWRPLRWLLMMPMSKSFLSVVLSTGWGRRLLRQAADIFRNMDQQPSVERLEGLQGRRLLFVAHLISRFAWILKSERWEQWTRKLEFWTHDTLLIGDQDDPLIHFQAYEDLAARMGVDQFFVTQGAGHISPLNSPHLITWEVMKFFLDRTVHPKSRVETPTG